MPSCQYVPGSPEHDAAAARDRRAHCHSMHAPPQPDEDPLSRNAETTAWPRREPGS